jgi:hypothetical protein
VLGKDCITAIIQPEWGESCGGMDGGPIGQEYKVKVGTPITLVRGHISLE